MKKLYCLMLSMLLLTVSAVGQTTITVGPSGANHTTIQAAINAANSGDIIQVAAGTYAETLNLGGKSLTISGSGTTQTIIDANGISGYAIQGFGDNSKLENLKLINSQYFGFKIQNISIITLENILVEGSAKTGIDINGVNGGTLTNIEVNNTVGGFGLMMHDSRNLTVTNVTTSGNAWGGVSIQTSGNYFTGGSENIVFAGTFNASEAVPLLLEQDPNTTTGAYFDITNVTLPAQFTHIFYTFRTGSNYKQWIYKASLADAKTLAGSIASPTQVDNLIYDLAEVNYYVVPGLLIQAAIDAATAGDVIEVAAGTYVENILVDKKVNIIGAGSDVDPLVNTIITQNTSGAGDTKVGVVQLNASGSNGDPLLLQNLRIEPDGMAGISVGRFTEATGLNVSHLALSNVYVVGTENADPCGEQERGLYVDLTSSLSNVNISNCAFNKLDYGWYLQKAVSADASNVTQIAVSNTEFKDNIAKGLYAEKLDNASFIDCEISNNGDLTWGNSCTYFKPWLSGIDINLKAGNYTNITIDNCTFTGNAIGEAKEGVALTVKARDDGATYGAFPATLSNVIIQNSTLTGNERGIRIGEPGKGNNSPINVNISACTIHSNRQQYSGVDGTFYGDIINQTANDDEVSVAGYGDILSGQAIWYVNNGQSIQGTIDAANVGDLIEVAAGTYVEDILIEIPLTLNGANADIVPGAANRGSESIIQPFTSGRAPIHLGDGTDNVTINGFEITASMSTNAIYCGVNGPSYLDIKFNYIHDIGTGAIGGNVYAINYRGGANSPTNVNISDNLINEVFNTTITADKSSAAIWLGQSSATGTVSNVTIERNTISNIKSDIANKVFEPSPYSDVGKYTASGIYIGIGWKNVGNVSGAIISDNTITNVIGGMAYAIQLSGNTPSIDISNNSISNISSPTSPNYSYGIGVPSTNTGTGILINNNSIANLQYGVTNGTTNSIDASCNWWGQATGPESGDVSGDVDYTPWLVSNDISNPDCSGAPVKVYASDGTTFKSGHATIQSAINAAVSGDVIEVEDGTYPENLEITETVTISSVNQHGAIIQTQAGFNAGNGYGGITFLADGSTLEGFKIEQNVNQAVIHTHNANNLTITDNWILGLASAAPRGIDVGYGSANSDGLLIEGNIFDDLYCAVYINQGTSLSIEANDFQDMGDGAVVFDGTWAYNNIDVKDNSTTAGTNYLMYFYGSQGKVTYSGNTLTLPTLLSNWGVYNVSLGNFYPSLQAAVSSASSDNALIMQEGVFVEGAQVNIIVNLSITGAGASSTFLKPGFNTSSTSYDASATGAFIHVNPGVSVSMSGIGIDGDGQNVKHGIVCQGVLDIQDCEFKNISHSSIYSGRGISFWGDNTGNLVKNCDFMNIGRIGIHVRGKALGVADNPNVTIENVTYTGKGVIDGLDYAVEFGGGGQGTVDNLTATNCLGEASSDNSTSAGVLITDYYGTGTQASVNNSTFTNNTSGISIGYASNDGSVVTLYKNDFSGNTYGVTALDDLANTVDAEENYWGSTDPMDVFAAYSGLVDASPWCNAGFTDCTFEFPAENVNTSVAYPTLQAAVDAASTNDVIEITAGGTFDGIVLNTGESITLINSSGEEVIIRGASPALTVTSGTMTVAGITYTTSTDDPTILINGGNLIIRNCIIEESTGFTQSCIKIESGTLDASGLNGDDGHNTFITDGSAKAIINQTATPAEAIGNYWGTLVYYDIANLMTGPVNFDPWCNDDFSVCGYSTNTAGPITTIEGTLEDAGTNPVIVPITVENFTDVDGVSIRITYDPGTVTLTNVTSPTLPGYGGVLPPDLSAWHFTTFNSIIIGWIDPSATGVSLADESVLFNLHFTFNNTTAGGTSKLQFDDSDDENCEYQNALIQAPFADDPQDDYWKDGWVSNLSVSFTRAYDPVEITAVPAGGESPYSYEWEGPLGQTANTATITPADGYGIYKVTVTDNLGAEVLGEYSYGRVHNINTYLDYMDIQAAIDATETLDGHTIQVDAESYYEQVLVNKELTIQGPNYLLEGYSASRVSEAIIRFPALSSPTDEENIVLITADNVTFEGFTVDGQDYVPADQANYQANGIMTQADNSILRNNRVVNSVTANIWATSWYWDGSAWATEFRNGIIISDNYVSNTSVYTDDFFYGYGIYVQGAYGDITDNVVEDCRSGIQVQPYNHPNSLNDVGTVSGNTFEGYVRGIYYNYSQNAAADWLFDDNTVLGIAAPGSVTPATWYGVSIRTYSGGEVSFTNNSIDADVSNATTTYGLIFRQNSANNPVASITDNDITGADYGVYIEAGITYVGNITIEDNSIAGNDFGLHNATTTLVDATPNWWGAATGPTHSGNPCGTGDAVTDYVDYSPWYYQAGMTTLNGLPVVTLSDVQDISTITNTPVIVSVSADYTAEDLSDYDPDVKVDNLLSSTVAFPANAEVISVTYDEGSGVTEVLTAPYDLSGKITVYLSEILGATTGNPLAGHDGLTTVWQVTIAGMDVATTYAITMDAVSYILQHSTCDNELGTDDFSITYADVAFSYTPETPVCYLDPANVEFTETYPLVENNGGDRILNDSKWEFYTDAAMTSPFSLPIGATITAGQVDGSGNFIWDRTSTLTTAVSQFYGSAVVTEQGDPSVYTNGQLIALERAPATNNWKAVLEGVPAGTYYVKVKNLAMLDPDGQQYQALTGPHGTFEEFVYNEQSFEVVVNACGLSGLLSYYNTQNSPLPGETIELWKDGASFASVSSDVNGDFFFPELNAGTYEIRPQTTLPVKSINATDAAQVNYWQVNAPSSYIEKVRFMAGDVNRIDATDLTPDVLGSFEAYRILSYFVTNGSQGWINAPAWSFWKANDQILANNWTDGRYPTVEVSDESVTQDVYGLITGDFNRSYVPGAKKSASNTLFLNDGKNVLVDAGTPVSLPFTLQGRLEAGAFSVILEYPANLVEVVGVNLTNNPNAPILYTAENGVLRIAWMNPQPIYLNAGDALFTLELRTAENLGSNAVIRFSLAADPMNEVADGQSRVVEDVQLFADVLSNSFLGMEENEHSIGINIFPNPVREQATLVYHLPENGKVKLELTNTLGQTVQLFCNEMQTSGTHSIQLNANHLNAGVYFVNITLETTTETLLNSRRLILQ